MVKFYLALAVVFALTQCGGGGQGSNIVPPTAKAVDKDKEIVHNLSGNVIHNKVEEFSENARELDQGIQQSCSGQAVSLDELRGAWTKAMMSFHYLDTVAMGPLAGLGKPGERGILGSRIYNWPRINDRGIDDQIDKAYKRGDRYRFRDDKFNWIGLGAMEYMLFARLADQESLSAEHQVCPYLKLVSADLAGAATELQQRYQAEEVEPLRTKTTAKEYRTVIQRMAQSLQFAEHVLLKRKVQVPLGMNPENYPPNQSGFVDYLEHPHAGVAREALAVNLRALAEVFSGGEGFGFDDYLGELGEKEAAVRFQSEIFLAMEELNAVPSAAGFTAAIANYNPEDCGQGTLCALHSRLKALADFIKGDLLLLMSKELPLGVQGDND